jgi:tetratricopeptide (TPR) repeat protein
VRLSSSIRLFSVCAYSYPYLTENYGSVLRDCSKALTLNNKSSKAYYRSALALTSLSRYEEALDCCSRCLTYDADNVGVKTVQARAAKLKEEADMREQKKQEEKRKEDEKKMVLKMALRVYPFCISSRWCMYLPLLL